MYYKVINTVDRNSKSTFKHYYIQFV